MTSSDKYTHTEIESRYDQPFYHKMSWDTCELLVDDDTTWKRFIETKKYYQKKIDIECEQLNYQYDRINEIQKQGITELVEIMKGKPVYYWSNTDKIYHYTTLYQIKPCRNIHTHPHMFKYNTNRSFEYLDLSLQLQGKEYFSCDLCPNSKDVLSVQGYPPPF